MTAWAARLADGTAAPLDLSALRRRETLLSTGRLDDPEFALARQFTATERIVVAAPQWNLLFSASLRTYFERVCVVGATFAYAPATGVPVSLCRAHTLTYVCTAGGPVPRNLGREYIRALCTAFFAIPTVRLLQATASSCPARRFPPFFPAPKPRGLSEAVRGAQPFARSIAARQSSEGTGPRVWHNLLEYVVTRLL